MSDDKLNPKKLQSGSATGTTRNKTVLKPGFSLVGWIRLTNSGEDLTGTKGKRFPVTLDELKKHNTKDDCWIAIRGKVYNITRYLDFHPGGVPDLMRGAGIDATKLFDEYHPWVNLEQLLAKCFIGPLKTAPTIDFNPFEFSAKKPSTLPPPKLPAFKEETETYEVALNKRVIPRFDWIQKSKDVTIYFYTKSFCNPGVSLTRKDEKNYEVEIYIDNYLHIYKFSFVKPLVHSPKSFKVNQESGKIEIVFDKCQEEVWSNFGLFEKIKTLQSDDVDYPSWTDCEALRTTPYNHNSFEFILRPKKDKIIITPIGYHVSFKCQELVRSYTPIPSLFLDESSSDSYDLKFLIKKYENGLSMHLAEYKNEELLEISQPKGSFDLNLLKDHRKILLLAAGSGLTPFLHLILFLLECKKIELVTLLYFNRTSSDIWCKKKFDELKDERLKVKYILSEPEEAWDGARGRISKELIEEEGVHDYTLVCGPKGFNEAIMKILNEFNVENVLCFDG